MELKLEWNAFLERWIVKKPSGRNIYEIPDCDNFNLIFKGLDKSKSNSYKLNAEKID